MVSLAHVLELNNALLLWFVARGVLIAEEIEFHQGWGMQTFRSQPKGFAKTMFHPILNYLVIIICCSADTVDGLSVL